MDQGDRVMYSPQVRVGNWFEELRDLDEKLKVFKKKREKGELLTEKALRLFENFHKEMRLEAWYENVSFGSVIQLIAPRMNICEKPSKKMVAVLSINIDESFLHQNQTINELCEVTIAPTGRPCARNTFRIVGVDCKDRSQEYLKFRQPFRLEYASSGKDPLYLYTSPKSINLDTTVKSSYAAQKVGEVNLSLGLAKLSAVGPGTNIPVAHLNWFCQHIDARKRQMAEGTALPANSPLVITHMVSNKNLAAENIMIPTLFGPEFLVSVQNYKDFFHREQWQNVWEIRQGHDLD